MRECVKYDCPNKVAGDANSSTNREVYCALHKAMYAKQPDPGPALETQVLARTAALELFDRISS